MKKLKFKIDMRECPDCQGYHAHWWYKSRVAPPSCAERQARKK